MTVVLYSGGIDSTVLLYDRIDQGEDVHALSADYGQSHRRELDAAAAICAELGVPHTITTLDPVLFAGSELTGGEGVIVPNRNMVLIALAGALAERSGHEAVAVACHATDAPLFPDCSNGFLEATWKALQKATLGRVRLHHPYSYMTKLDVVRRGVKLGVPFERTWSCYVGGEEPCGGCLACRERREALLLAGAPA